MSADTHELLTSFNELSFYQQHFMDAALWTPYVQLACRKLGLSCEQVTRGLPGSFPTFIVDDKWVVKLFGKLFNGLESFQAELHAARVVSACKVIPTAVLLGAGALFEQDVDWQWPFLVFEYLPGVSLGEVFDQVCQEDLVSIAEQMGNITRALHHLPLIPGPAFPVTWESSLTEMEMLRSASPTNHRHWHTLPEHLIDQIEDYLAPVSDLVESYRTPYLIHADLTRDHLLGLWKGSRWSTLGLIDWGDAWLGGFYYELVALYLDMLHGEPFLLRAYLAAYMPETGLLVDFARRALSAALLHRFDVFHSDLLNRHPELLTVRSLEEFAEKLYGHVL